MFKNINRIFSDETVQDEDIKTVIRDIFEREKQQGFSFENAQKLINMIVKYMFLTTYKNGNLI